MNMCIPLFWILDVILFCLQDLYLQTFINRFWTEPLSSLVRSSQFLASCLNDLELGFSWWLLANMVMRYRYMWIYSRLMNCCVKHIIVLDLMSSLWSQALIFSWPFMPLWCFKFLVHGWQTLLSRTFSIVSVVFKCGERFMILGGVCCLASGCR